MPDPYFSELKFLGAGSLDFIEVAVNQGLDVSNIQVIIYHPNGTVRSVNDLGAVDGTVAGRDVYVIDQATSASFTGVHKDGAAALVVDGIVTQFVSFDSIVTATNGPAIGMTSTALGPTGVGESLESNDGGASYDVQSTPNPDTVPCFVSGTPILTAQGPRPVETLRAGDLVWTEDAGLQPVIWAGGRTLPLNHSGDPALRPVRIPAGAFGPGTPLQDLYLSPNHRAVLSHPLCALYFGAREVFAPAKALMGHRGIGHAPVPMPVCYHHILLAGHHVLRAAGLACESFHPEPVGLGAFEAATRAEIHRALPRLASDPLSYGPTARMVIKRTEAELVLRQAGDDSLDLADSPDARSAA
nr:Hint domain-containing protein [uncultured Roseovarius sp.]